MRHMLRTLLRHVKMCCSLVLESPEQPETPQIILLEHAQELCHLHGMRLQCAGGSRTHRFVSVNGIYSTGQTP